MMAQAPFQLPGDTPAAIPHIGKNGQALSEKERAKIAQKKGICLNCGVKTHKVSLLSRTPLSSDRVHKGICIPCNPNDVPHGVYLEFEQRNPKPAAVTTAPAPGGAGSRTKAGRSTSAGSRPGRPTSNQGSVTNPISPMRPRGTPNLELNGNRPGGGARSPNPMRNSRGARNPNPVMRNSSTASTGSRSAGIPAPPFNNNAAPPRQQQQQQRNPAPKPPQPPKKKPSSSDPWGDDYEAPVVQESEEVRMARAKAWQQVAGAKMDQEEQEERANEALTRFQEGGGPNINNEQFNVSGVHGDFLGGGYNEGSAYGGGETVDEAQARMAQEEEEARMNRFQNRLQQRNAAPPAPAPAPKPSNKKSNNSDPWGDDYEAPVVMESEDVRMARAKAWQEVAGAKMDQEEQEERANEALTRFQEQNNQAGVPTGGADDFNNSSAAAASGLHSDFNLLGVQGGNSTESAGIPAPKPTSATRSGSAGDNSYNSNDYSDYQQQGQQGNYRSAIPAPPPPAAKNLDIKINIPPDQTFTVTVPNATEQTTVKQMKKEIQKRKGIPAGQQELCLNFETLLMDDETLAFYNLLEPSDKACIDMFHPPEFPCCKVVIDFFGEQHVIVVQHPGRDNINSVLETIQSSPFFTDQLQYMSPEEVQRINLQLIYKDQKLSKDPNITLADHEIPHRAVLQLDFSQQEEENFNSNNNTAAAMIPNEEEDQMALIARLQQEAFGAYNG